MLQKEFEFLQILQVTLLVNYLAFCRNTQCLFKVAHLPSGSNHCLLLVSALFWEPIPLKEISEMSTDQGNIKSNSFRQSTSSQEPPLWHQLKQSFIVQNVLKCNELQCSLYAYWTFLKKIKLFNSKARNLLCLTIQDIFHMAIIILHRCCCKSALVWIKRNTWSDIIEIYRRFVALCLHKSMVWTQTLILWIFAKSIQSFNPGSNLHLNKGKNAVGGSGVVLGPR